MVRWSLNRAKTLCNGAPVDTSERETRQKVRPPIVWASSRWPGTVEAQVLVPPRTKNVRAPMVARRSLPKTAKEESH
jgi:hypothetical protein